MARPVPLVVDLDGTLVHADLTLELCLLHIRRWSIVAVLQLASWFLRGRAAAKAKLAQLYRDQMVVAALPISTLQETDLYKQATHRALVSGSPHSLVVRIAAQIGGFDLVRGTQGSVNLIGAHKAAFLVATYPDGFDYVGDSKHDIEVWRAARRAYAFNASNETLRKAEARGIRPEVLSQRKPWLPAALKAMRMHQWTKNSLLLLIPFLNFTSFEVVWLWYGLAGFFAFSLVASATYLLNDLLDIQVDRQHKIKRNRPFARGALPIQQGLAFMGALGAAGLALAMALGWVYFSLVVIYTLASAIYSFVLKQVVLVDAFTLTILYCWRVFAGALLFGLTTNAWFLISLGFFFFGLALGKRAVELRARGADGEQIHGRGYEGEDVMIVSIAGVTSSFMSVGFVLIFALLDQSLLLQTAAISIAVGAFITFWIMRFWLLVHRGQVNDDPVIFALKDRVSLSTFALIFVLVLGETLVLKIGVA